MKDFTINDLERFSGIKAHTLRIWERRYSVLQPVRSQRNIRHYTLDELKKILDISLLNKNGYRISTLSKIQSSDIAHKIVGLGNDDSKWQKAINDLTINMYTTEPESFEWVLDELLLHWPIDILIEKIIFPFLLVTDLLWKGNKLSEEHLVVTAIRKKLIFGIESTPVIINKEKIVLLFLPDNRQLDLGLLYGYYFFKSRGVRVIYLGIDVTVKNLETIFQVKPPCYVFSYLQPNHHFFKKALLASLSQYAPGAKLLVADDKLTCGDTASGDNEVRMHYSNALECIVKTCS